jgi:peptidoglycan/LPS O-acetylase OafA/YrhL
MLGALLAVFLHRAPVHYGVHVQEAGFTWIALFCLALLLAARHDPVIGRALRLWPLTRLGAISYGVYLIHPAVLWIAHWWGRHQLPQIVSGTDAGITLLAFVATITLATISYRAYEAPLIRIGRRWRYGST